MENHILDTPFSEAPDPSNLTYSTFGSRLIASIIDGLIIAAVTLVLTFLNTIDQNMFFITSIAQFGFLFFYEVYLVQATGATLGKRTMDLKVVTVNGLPVGWKEAFTRYLPSLILGAMGTLITVSAVANMDADYYEELSWFQRLQQLGEGDSSLATVHQYLNIGWIITDIIVFFASKNLRALHDLIANTVVISTK